MMKRPGCEAGSFSWSQELGCGDCQQDQNRNGQYLRSLIYNLSKVAGGLTEPARSIFYDFEKSSPFHGRAHGTSSPAGTRRQLSMVWVSTPTPEFLHPLRILTPCVVFLSCPD